MNKLITSYASFIVYICSFLFVLEWVYFPFIHTEYIEHSRVLLFYIVFCYVVLAFSLRWWIVIILKLSMLLLIVNQLFFKTIPFSAEWQAMFADEWATNWDYISIGAYDFITAPLRTVFFMLLIWVLCYFIYYLFMHTRRLLLFVIATFLYVGMLETITDYVANTAIVRVFIISLLALGMNQFIKVASDRRAVVSSFQRNFIWFVPVLAVVLFAAMVGYTAPKKEAQWTEPIPLISTFIGGEGEGDGKKSGYSEDDTELGGSFEFSHDPLFYAKAKTDQYWKIETKDYYSGKGWVTSTEGSNSRFQTNYEPNRFIEQLYMKVMIDYLDEHFGVEYSLIGMMNEEDVDIGGLYIYEIDNYVLGYIQELKEAGEELPYEVVLPDETVLELDVDDEFEVYTYMSHLMNHARWHEIIYGDEKPFDPNHLDEDIEMFINYVNEKVMEIEEQYRDVDETSIEFVEGKSLPKLVYPYGIRQFKYKERGVIYHNSEDDSYAIQQSRENIELDAYTVEYQETDYFTDLLQEALESGEYTYDSLYWGGYFPLDQYTQLPDDLPERIHELTISITDEYDSNFDKAKAVERYFAEAAFLYETDDVPYPAEDQDYVDQFLFETKRGYCNNFSTAMAVMLRTIDIPTRWVKGFASGEVIDRVSHNGEMMNEYEVTDAQAHAWVEVYFTNYGWIPFEPTIGFDNPEPFIHSSTILEEEEEAESDVSNNEREEPEEDEREQPEVAEKPEVDKEDDDKDEASETFWITWMWPIVWGVLSIIVIGGIVVLFMRWEWLKRRIVRKRWERRRDGEMFEKAYGHLLYVLKRRGYGKDPHITLRQFAERIDAAYETKRMSELTSIYERFVYRNDLVDEEQEATIVLWEQLLEDVVGR